MLAARSMASSSEAGCPAMVATGRSSTWWLRNQALPSTQAFLALVMWLPSTVSSMSSQTQPQKVQVALLTTFSSGVALMAGVAPFRVGEGITPDTGRRVPRQQAFTCGRAARAPAALRGAGAAGGPG